MRPNSDNEIWRFETARYAVTCHALEEDMPPEDSFEFDDDIAFARSGDPAAWFCTCVRVVNKETGLELGCDYLGGCSYRSFDDFVGGHREGGPGSRNCLATKARNIVVCHSFPGMVRQAIDEARATLDKLCKCA